MPPTTVLAEEGSMTEPRYPTGDATQGPFSFGASGFRVGHTCRESGTRLRGFLFPELLKSEKARNSAQVAASIIDRTWTKAQLQHYGINFNPELDPFKAKALLLTSVAHGLCDAVPPQILRIKATLKEEYKRMMEDYRDRMKAYHAQKLPKRIQTFEACATPTEEAECDQSLFLRKYFLNEDGNPDRTKAPDLILLPGYKERGLALTGRIERVPALHVADGGLGGASNVTVIGWNRERVHHKAHDIDIHQSDGDILRFSHNWDNQMMMMHRYVEERCSQAKTSGPKAGTSFDRSNVTGKYFVKCDYILHDWPLLSKQLRIRFRGGRLATFDLGIIVGLMVLGKTQVAVTKIVQDGTWNADDDGDGESEEVTSDEEDSYDERESGCGDDSNHNTNDEPDTPVDLTSDRPLKRQKIENGQLRRLYFQWRGYNTMSGAIKFDPQGCNTGYLDFANDEATNFEGNICMDAQIAIGFQGYKIPGPAGPLTMNWNALSHLDSERANVPEHVW